MDLQKEKNKRNTALENIKENRAFLVKEAEKLAVSIAKKKGTVTSPEVLSKIREKFEEARHIDGRFMGVVFAQKGTWTRVKFVNEGSHCQPISVWKLKNA